MVNDSSKFWWIKLADEFLFGPECSFMMAQEGGSDYIVLYQMICSRFKETNGRLIQVMGKVFIRFRVQEVYNEFKKYFDYSKVALAMELYIRLGLLEEEPDGTFFIPNFGNLIGCETLAARRKRKQRAKNQQLDCENQKMLKGTTCGTDEEQTVGQCPTNNNVDNDTTYKCGTNGGTMSTQRQTQNQNKSVENKDRPSVNQNLDKGIDAELEFFKEAISTNIKNYLYDINDPTPAVRLQNYAEMIAEATQININGAPHKAAEVLSILQFYCTAERKDELMRLISVADAKVSNGEVFNGFIYTVAALYNYAREHGATTQVRRI